MREFLKEVAVFCLFGWILGMSTAAAYGQVGPQRSKTASSNRQFRFFSCGSCRFICCSWRKWPGRPGAVAPVEDSWGVMIKVKAVVWRC